MSPGDATQTAVGRLAVIKLQTCERWSRPFSSSPDWALRVSGSISWIKRIHPRWELSCSAQHVSCLGLTGLLVWVWSVCWGGLTEHDWQLVSSLDSLCWLQSVRNMTLFTTVSLSAAFCVMNEDKLPPCMTDSYSTAQNNSSCRAENRFIWFPWVVSTGVCSTSAEVNE